ncbi:MAG: ATP-binding cassette domain-containing protein, partial [Phycisphaeraceae bacterium]
MPDTKTNATATTPVLRVENLHKHYRMGREDLHVLRGVDLGVEPGKWVCIFGRSGSGKSTLLHLLGGLDTPDQGTVYFNDQEIFELSTAQRDRFRSVHVGFV